MSCVCQWSWGDLVVSVHSLPKDPQTGHDLVPIQVRALQVSTGVGIRQVVPAAVEQSPVVKGHQVACGEVGGIMCWENSRKGATLHMSSRRCHNWPNTEGSEGASSLSHLISSLLFS